ncbi:MAG: glycosyltransferase family 2 protein, partial [Anaerolineae bacterium]
ALMYNPVRVLGAMGAIGVLAAGAVGFVLAIMRVQGITTLGPWGVFSVYAALVMGVSGVSLFALGATFNYLVGLFHKRPIHQGLFGRPIFDPPLDRQFGWMGLLSALGGLALGTVSLILGLNGWPIARLWLYLVGSAMLSLVGLQLMISWLLMRVLDELSRREFYVNCDLVGEDR